MMQTNTPEPDMSHRVNPNPSLQFVQRAMTGLPVLLVPVLLMLLWVWGPPDRRPALLAVAAGLFAGQALNLLLGTIGF